MKNKIKSLENKATYFYIKNIKKWMFCPACKTGKMTYRKSDKTWACEECGYDFTEEYFLDDCVFWFCDECGEYLNKQEGFDLHSLKHVCRNCGYENDTSFSNIKGICADCGKSLSDPDATLCVDCKQIRREKAKLWLITAGTVLGTAAVAVGAAIIASQTQDDNNSDYSPSLCGNENDDESNIRAPQAKTICDASSNERDNVIQKDIVNTTINNTTITDLSSKTAEEQLFRGVPVSQLNIIAKSIPKGECAFVRDGFLWFYYKSNRGHHTEKCQLHVVDGKLEKCFPGDYYSGQWWDRADDFVDTVNSMCQFDYS